jgi:hypothetical protein
MYIYLVLSASCGYLTQKSLTLCNVSVVYSVSPVELGHSVGSYFDKLRCVVCLERAAKLPLGTRTRITFRFNLM